MPRPQRRRPAAHVYTGRRMELDFVNADIHNIMQAHRRVGQVNIILADDVKGTVTMHLRDVPWDQALDVIAKAKGLGMQREGNLIRVAPQAVLEKELERRWRGRRRRSSCGRSRRGSSRSATPTARRSCRASARSCRRAATCRSTRAPTSSSSPTWRRNIALAEDLVTQPRHADAAGAHRGAHRRGDDQLHARHRHPVGRQHASTRPPPATRPASPSRRRWASPAAPPTRPPTSTACSSAQSGAASPNFAVNMPAAVGTGSGGALGLDARIAQRRLQHQPAPLVAGEHRQRAHHLGAEDHDARQHRGVDRAGHVDPDLGRVGAPAPTRCSSTPSSTSRSSRT